jgi:protein disulfide-isomerase A1
VFNQRDKLTVYVFTSGDQVPVRHELIYLAIIYQELVTFTVVDLARYKHVPRHFGVEIKGEVSLIVHAPMNDDIYRYKQGECVQSDFVEEMLMTILQGKAVDGQVFGSGARGTEKKGKSGHDEL